MPTFNVKIGLPTQAYPTQAKPAFSIPLDRIADHHERRIDFLQSFNGLKNNVEAGIIAYHCNTPMHLTTNYNRMIKQHLCFVLSVVHISPLSCEHPYSRTTPYYTWALPHKSPIINRYHISKLFKGTRCVIVAGVRLSTSYLLLLAVDDLGAPHCRIARCDEEGIGLPAIQPHPRRFPLSGSW